MYVDFEEHKHLSISELREELNNLTIGVHFYKKMPNMGEAIITTTAFLENIYKDVDMKTRIDFIRKGFTTEYDLICPVCKTNHLSISAKKLFNSTCGRKCTDEMNRDKISKSHRNRTKEEIELSNKKRQETCEKNYGTNNVAKLSETIEKGKQTCFKRYGKYSPSQVEEFKKKAQETCNANFGVPNPMMCGEVVKRNIDTVRKNHNVDNVSELSWVKEKKKKTSLKNNGAENPMHNDEIKNKAITNAQTAIKMNHNVDNPILVEGALQKREQTYLENWGETHAQKTEQMREKNRQRAYDRMDDTQKLAYDILRNREELEKCYKEHGIDWICEKYHIAYQTVYKHLGVLDIELKGFAKISESEMEVYRFLTDDLGIKNIIQSNRKLLGNRREIDMFIPELNIGIEFNGVYYHSSKFLEDDYHYDKWEKAKRNGIRLIQIFEDEWEFNKDLVKKKLSNILKLDNTPSVYARKTVCVELTNREVKDFLNNNHIQGATTGTHVFGLMEGDELVSAMVFKTGRESGAIEIVRFASSKRVVGGFSKILKQFVKLYGDRYTIITSFADKRWSVGDVYLKNGFTHVYDTKPSYTYVVGMTRRHKSGFRKNKLEKMLKDYNPDETERTNTFRNKIYRIYDCGLMKFVLDLKKIREEEETKIA